MSWNWDTFFGLMAELNSWSIIARLCLAVVCGGVIGMERGKKGRPAGFRTHILVCLGSALAMLTNQYLTGIYGGDPARLGAQVISGIGFLGAGTIIVTGRHQVKGLTTAAGLWASACMGLAIGVGFYEAAIIACFFIWLVSSALHRLDHYILSTSKVMDIYIEFGETADISSFMTKIRVHGIRVEAIEITKANVGSDATVAAVLTLKSEQKRDHADLLALISEIQGVKFVEPI
ncbi:MAG: MgtC/SapB family protein [Angelakisella sp.]|nr:MgtC/SapB family protein [Angelakisella sp.]